MGVGRLREVEDFVAVIKGLECKGFFFLLLRGVFNMGWNLK